MLAVKFSAVLLAALLCAFVATPAGAESQAVLVASPDGSVDVRLEVLGNGAPAYSVRFRDKEIVAPSGVGVVFSDGSMVNGLRVAGVARRSGDETYPVYFGKSATARDRFEEAVVTLEGVAPPQRKIEIVLRVYDDGVAFRYRFPAREGLSDFVIAEERSEFRIAGDPQAYAQVLGTYTSPYEVLYHVSPLSALPPGELIGLPLLLRHEDGPYIALTEANLTDYAGMYLTASKDEPGVLVSQLSPWPGDPDVKVKATAPHESPWRVIMVGDDPGVLIESNLILNLNAPCRIADTSWIHPGKVNFPWFNGYVVTGQDFEGRLDTATLKYTIDFCAEAGIAYASLDGFRGAWYGGPIRPDGPVDVTTAIPEIDLPEVLRYAKEKGVRMRAWVHWAALAPQLDSALAAYDAMGIEGIMVDFMDRDDQEMVNLYHEMAEKAAKHHLTVNFHGAYKPTGIRRTWPNVLTREAVRNLEYNKFSGAPCTPEHDLIVPFTRMLAGPLDYHHGAFNSVTAADFKGQYIAPMAIGTRCHFLAMYVVYENQLPMLADHPGAYRGQPGLDFLSRVPTYWDETRYIDGAVGDYIVIARRSGEVWYVGAMSDEVPRKVDVPLDFLAPGTFTAEIWADAPDADTFPKNVTRGKRDVTKDDILAVEMAPGGGQVMRLAPEN